MASVRLDNLCKHFGPVRAVDRVSLEIPDGELMVLVGPSGCGKSTLLRLVAGLEEPSGGGIYLDDRDVGRVKPQDRDVAMVFQNYALFPHLNVEQNMGFSLKFRKAAKPEIRARVTEAAEMLGLADQLRRKPAELSGGQRQRVALGRAMVCQPKVFLLDEPLSNLDARMRAEMRAEIAQLHRRLGTTMIFVTHDQTEAMTLGQRLCVLDGGQVMQTGSPMDLYRRPAHRFVGDFIGTPGMNFVRGRIAERDGGLAFVGSGDGFSLRLANGLVRYAGREVELGIRPEQISLGDGAGDATGTVEGCETLGHESLLCVRCGGHELVVRLPGVGAGGLAKVGMRFDLAAAVWFDATTGQALE
ncbi:MAG: ATP-binding cassette domain-containing protein [Verrucomicrobia bacterium]|nr:ATP-binding cassette domain-containing protein [Verrucomicrobiota bacterium]